MSNLSVQRSLNTLIQACGWEPVLRALESCARGKSQLEAAAGKKDSAWAWVQLAEVLRRCHVSHLPPE